MPGALLPEGEEISPAVARMRVFQFTRFRQ